MAHFVAFHSSRGGVGRTRAAVSVARALARRGIRTLVLDLDIAAPGAENLPWLQDCCSARPGLTSVLRKMGFGTEKDPNLKLTAEVESAFAAGVAMYRFQAKNAVSSNSCFWVMPAKGCTEDGKHEAVVRTDWVGLYEKSGVPGFHAWEMIKGIADRYRPAIGDQLMDVVILDVPSGVDMRSRICTLELARQLLTFVRPAEADMGISASQRQRLVETYPRQNEGPFVDANVMLTLVPKLPEWELADVLKRYIKHFPGLPDVIVPYSGRVHRDPSPRSTKPLAAAYEAMADLIEQHVPGISRERRETLFRNRAEREKVIGRMLSKAYT